MKNFSLIILSIIFAIPVFGQTVTEEWLRIYNGTANGDDYKHAMTVDGEGNVYVTGIVFTGAPFWFEGVIIKYNSTGDIMWEVISDSISPRLISVDDTGNVYVSGIGYSGGFSVVKYNTNGVRQWRHSHPASGSLEETVAMTVDSSGNSYITGRTYISGNDYDYKTVKVNASGNLVWLRTYNGSDNRNDYARAIAVDGLGNVYVTGEIQLSTNPRTRIGTLKYDSSGTLLWVRTWLDSNYSFPKAADLLIDNFGNLYITGSALGPSSDPHFYWNYYVTLKYNSSGTLLWTQFYKGIGGFNCNDNWSNAVTSDSSGNIYVTGASMPDNCKIETVTIKYSSGGAVEWVSRFFDPDGEDNEGTSIIVDDDGNVYVLGYRNDGKILFIKYNSLGQQEWYEKNTGPYNEYFADPEFGLDNYGNIYVSGTSEGIGTGRDIITIKYSQETPKRRPVFIVPGIAGTYAANTQNDKNWLLNRGIHPESTQVDPIGRYYDDVIQTLKNEGYVEGKDLFVVNYDWRLPPGPVDNNIDGHINGISAASISNDNFEYSVDYLGWYMKKACERWRQDHDEELDSVDIISHSTGGLVGRTYIQSDAYNSVYDNVNGYKLPRIKNFIMLGVPNRGASKPWNILQDNWSGDVAYRFVLSKMLHRAFLYMKEGNTITGPDGNITWQSILDNQGEPDKKLFIYKYVPTVRYLLATYSFLDLGSGPIDINSDPDLRNTILLDLNNGFDINPLNDPNGFTDSANVIVIYSSGKNTASISEKRTDFEFLATHSFTDVAPRYSKPPSIWYNDVKDSNNGDGTVPKTSSAGQFLLDLRPELIEINEADHTGIVGNVNVQTTMLDRMGVSFNSSNISTGSGKNLDVIVKILFKGTGFGFSFERPVSGNGQYITKSSTTDDPNVLWLGTDTDGMVYAFDESAETINIQLTGTGEDYYVMISYEDSVNNSGVVLEGHLDVGEVVNYELRVSELQLVDVGVSSIVSPQPDQILNRSGSSITAYVTNFGLDTVKNCNVYYSINDEVFGPINIPEILAPNDSVLVTFSNAYRLRSQDDLINQTLSVFTENTNDTNISNDSKSVSISLVTPIVSFPYLEDFSNSPSYSSSGESGIWSYDEGVSPSGVSADAMVRADFFSNPTGMSLFKTPIIDLTTLTNPLLSFYVSYTSNLSFNNDELEVLISFDSGVNFDSTIYLKSFSSQPSLATTTPQVSAFIPSSSNQWRKVIVDLSDYIGQEIVIGFKGVSAGGNNLWIDNLKIAETDNVELITVNGIGTYGNILSSQAQVNITGFNLLRSGRSNTFVSPDASEGELVISRVDDFPANQNVNTNTLATTFSGAIFTPDVISDKYWDVSYSGDDYNSLATYNFIIDISSQLGIVDADRIYILKRNNDNDSWECLSTVTEYEAGLPVKIIATGLNGFGQFAFGTDDGTLPVDLVEFNANVDKNNVTLNWTTAWEENNMRFDVQRRIAETDATWATVGSVTGSGTTQEHKFYSYLDRNLVTGMYEYRLVQVDFDGNSTADHTLSSQVEVGIPSTFALAQNYPNPFNPVTKIGFQIPVEGMTKLAIFDISGREVATLVNEVLTPGYYTYSFNGANFASGVYFYRLVTSNSVITKRAVLVK